MVIEFLVNHMVIQNENYAAYQFTFQLGMAICGSSDQRNTAGVVYGLLIVLPSSSGTQKL